MSKMVVFTTTFLLRSFRVSSTQQSMAVVPKSVAFPSTDLRFTFQSVSTFLISPQVLHSFYAREFRCYYSVHGQLSTPVVPKVVASPSPDLRFKVPYVYTSPQLLRCLCSSPRDFQSGNFVDSKYSMHEEVYPSYIRMAKTKEGAFVSITGALHMKWMSLLIEDSRYFAKTIEMVVNNGSKELGVRLTRYDIKDIHIPSGLKKAMEWEAEARRKKIKGDVFSFVLARERAMAMRLDIGDNNNARAVTDLEAEAGYKKIKSEGQQCCDNAPALSSSCGPGHVEEIGGIKSYVSGSLDSELCILLVSDDFGYEAPNLRKIADKVGAAGFYAVVPDFFLGDPFLPENAEGHALTWLKDQSQDGRFEIAKPVIEDLKSKGVSKIGAAGFCWGAKIVVELAKHAYVQAAVILHPSFVTVEDINGVKVPILILGAETDHRSPPEVLKQFEEALKAKSEVDCFVKIFPGVAHGWSLRYKEGDEHVAKCAKEAHQDMLDWFIEYLK